MKGRLTALLAKLKTCKPIAMSIACCSACFGRNTLRDADAESEVAVRTFPIIGRSSGRGDGAARTDVLETTLVLPAANGLLDGRNWNCGGLVVDVNAVPCSAEGRSIAGAVRAAFTKIGDSTRTVYGIVTVYDQALRSLDPLKGITLTTFLTEIILVNDRLGGGKTNPCIFNSGILVISAERSA